MDSDISVKGCDGSYKMIGKAANGMEDYDRKGCVK